MNSASNGGPCVPELGCLRTNWCTKRKTETLEDFESRPAQLEDGEEDTFREYDRFPVPVSWVGNLFQQESWDVLVRKYGDQGTAMGPLTHGTRSGGTNRWYIDRLWKDEDGEEVGPQDFEPVVIDDKMSEDEQISVESENKRRAVATRI